MFFHIVANTDISPKQFKELWNGLMIKSKVNLEAWLFYFMGLAGLKLPDYESNTSNF